MVSTVVEAEMMGAQTFSPMEAARVLEESDILDLGLSFLSCGPQVKAENLCAQA